MPPTQEQGPNDGELFPNLEGLEKGEALLEKLKDLLPEETLPEEPWSHGEYGQIIGTEYLPELTMAVMMSDDVQTEKIHSQLHKLIELEKTLCRFTEKLRAPNIKDFENLQNDLDEMLTHINQPISAADALKDELRQKTIRPAFTKISEQIKKLFTETRLRMIGNEDEYKDFWENQYPKYNEIRILLGSQKDGQIVLDEKPDPLLKLLVK